jgi:signal transduction histidine kinase
MQGSIAGWVARTGQPLVVQDVSKDERHYRRVDQHTDFTTRGILAVPLATRGKVLGVLEAINKTGDAEFTEEDVELLTVLGDQAAVAVQNALLFQQSDLIAEIVHEMRTPLAAIVAHTRLLQIPGTSPARRDEVAQVIQGEAVRLNTLTKRYLDLARLESGRTTLAREPVDMAEVIRKAIDVLRPDADHKEIPLVSEIPTDLARVAGDAQRLHQVMLNLLGNAVKYCSTGDTVTVRARSDRGYLVVSVCDSGPGIRTEALPHIFERFYRVPTAGGETPGVGLGLCITRQIVEALGGEISVMSQPGHGATFRFTVPAWVAT